MAAYETCLRHAPSAFGAPGRVLTEEAVTELARIPFASLSCTWAAAPFVHAGTDIPEIPSDLPCLEEVGGERGVGRIPASLRPGGFHVLPVHAEVEGGMLQTVIPDRAAFGKGLPLRGVTTGDPRKKIQEGISFSPGSR